ncbi:receptor-interacting serine/threonine-protein kinase 3-like isoform X2 [Solea solea]|uniref:receptor-interacting serine/threonine-protein kinase 3-like isoform X2 n=1 Tax=Solea solea TaxID=90069 RepID=UPI00272967F1|nr:receptor-interacting serine/threonine-protein kinase 3-like isoform X2 [Solea solea]
MALLSHTAELVGNESLEKWEYVGSGGFGRVYKARHKHWGFDVAIKLLHGGVGTLVSAEADLMNKASCEFVLRVYGSYEGNFRGASVQSGIVMEFMSRGSVQTLIQDLSGHPPWPLTFRLAHQVALGMNFLHSRNLIHHDLKPSNVLLNDDLNAKLADFGLSRVSTSALNSNEKKSGEVGGSYKYMPPEAFKASYEPVRAFDRYSYGILLWSIVTGKEPYPSADSCLVALKIPLGERPSLEDINQGEAEGLKDLLDLMKVCWDENPMKRPCFKECLEVTETLFSKQRIEIHVAVHHVLTTLSNTSNQHSSVTFHCFPQTTEQSKAHATVNGVRVIQSEKASAQDNSTKTVSDRDKAKFVDNNRAALIQHVSEVMAIVEELGNMVHTETYSVIEAEKTSHQQMRALFQRTFRPGGVTVKAAFYTALQRHHPELVERLGG